jgi:hypothetical protein
LIQETALSLDDPLLSLVNQEPSGAVNLGELLDVTRVRWPLGREGVALDRRRITVPLDRPSMDDLAIGLPDRRQG